MQLYVHCDRLGTCPIGHRGQFVIPHTSVLILGPHYLRCKKQTNYKIVEYCSSSLFQVYISYNWTTQCHSVWLQFISLTRSFTCSDYNHLLLFPSLLLVCGSTPADSCVWTLWGSCFCCCKVCEHEGFILRTWALIREVGRALGASTPLPLVSEYFRTEASI